MSNGVMMQYFHWYNPNDGNLWNQLDKTAHELVNAGFYCLMVAATLQRQWWQL